MLVTALYGPRIPYIRPKKLKDVTVGKFFSQMGKFLEQEADIRASKSEITIVCKDMDEITTKKGARGAMEKQFDLIGLQIGIISLLDTVVSGESKHRLG